jgi:hypothetical protein
MKMQKLYFPREKPSHCRRAVVGVYLFLPSNKPFNLGKNCPGKWRLCVAEALLAGASKCRMAILYQAGRRKPCITVWMLSFIYAGDCNKISYRIISGLGSKLVVIGHVWSSVYWMVKNKSDGTHEYTHA